VRASSAASSNSGRTPPSSPRYEGRRAKRPAAEDVGADLLTAWQNRWSSLHEEAEENFKEARRCAQAMLALKARTERDWAQVAALQTLASQAPAVAKQVDEISLSLAHLETSLGDVEVALIALEDTVDAQEAERRQRERARQQDEYRLRREAEFKRLSAQLQADHLRSRREKERQEVESLQAKQREFQKRFEADLATFSSSNDAHHLKVPPRQNPDASLETVDLDEDDGADLEDFLGGGDVPGASPLPPDEETDKANPLPVSDSVYFTPDDTMENLKEAANCNSSE